MPLKKLIGKLSNKKNFLKLNKRQQIVRFFLKKGRNFAIFFIFIK